MLFRKAWEIGWCVLVFLSIFALWDVSERTCDNHIPILLSRALTTDPWRGFILAFNLIVLSSSFYLNSLFMSMGFLGFLCAFLVSMFETNAHEILIIISAGIVMYECYPMKNKYWFGFKGISAFKNRESLWWRSHWWFTFICGVVFSTSLLYLNYGCRDEICAKCSWWYISEYLFFWSMFSLVWWRIPKNELIEDEILFVTSVPTSLPTSHKLQF